MTSRTTTRIPLRYDTKSAFRNTVRFGPFRGHTGPIATIMRPQCTGYAGHPGLNNDCESNGSREATGCYESNDRNVHKRAITASTVATTTNGDSHLSLATFDKPNLDR